MKTVTTFRVVIAAPGRVGYPPGEWSHVLYRPLAQDIVDRLAGAGVAASGVEIPPVEPSRLLVGQRGPGLSRAATLRQQADERARLIRALGWAPEPVPCPPGERYCATIGDLRYDLARLLDDPDAA